MLSWIRILVDRFVIFNRRYTKEGLYLENSRVVTLIGGRNAFFRSSPRMLRALADVARYREFQTDSGAAKRRWGR
jgi:hypothetical protein